LFLLKNSKNFFLISVNSICAISILNTDISYLVYIRMIVFFSVLGHERPVKAFR
jgi:hypothetical protein